MSSLLIFQLNCLKNNILIFLSNAKSGRACSLLTLSVFYSKLQKIAYVRYIHVPLFILQKFTHDAGNEVGGAVHN